MPEDARLSERHSTFRSHGTLIAAAVIAAHGATARGQGFRATDVRFFFFLFSNWLEHDLVHKTESLDLTQVRRLVVRLTARGWMRRTSSPSESRAANARGGARSTLTPDGLEGLVEALTTDLDAHTFEESLFVIYFASAYREAVLRRTSPGRRAHIAERLSPRRLVRVAEQRVTRVIADLEERARSSRDLHDEAAHMRALGTHDVQIAAALDRRDTYQLQHVRTFGELMRSLPRDLLHFELGAGITARNRLLFEPMTTSARAQLSVLKELRAAVRR